MSKAAMHHVGFTLILFSLLILFGGCAGTPQGMDYQNGPENLTQELREHAIEPSSAAPVSAEIQWRILNWPQGKRAAVSLTFDDGTVDQYKVALPLMERHGVRATYFLITGARTKRGQQGLWLDGKHSRRLFDWEAAAEIASKGHEIGSHGVSHSDLRRLFWRDELNQVERELRWSQKAIERYIPHEYLPAGKLLSFSWPYWRSTPELRQMAEEYYLAARSGRGRQPLRTPRDPYSIHSVRVMTSDSTEKWRQALDTVRKTGGWALFSLHGIDNGRMQESELGWQPISDEKFTRLMRMVKSDDLWAAPFGEVFRYSSEWNAARLEIVRLSSGSVTLRLEDGLDDKVFDQALTVELTLPEEVWSGFSGIAVESSTGRMKSIIKNMRRSGRSVTIWLELQPNGEPIVLRGLASTHDSIPQLYN